MTAGAPTPAAPVYAYAPVPMPMPVTAGTHGLDPNDGIPMFAYNNYAGAPPPPPAPVAPAPPPPPPPGVAGAAPPLTFPSGFMPTMPDFLAAIVQREPMQIDEV